MGFDPAQDRRVRGYYVPFFKGCQRVLDVACGRGEFLDVLRDAQIPGEGVDNDRGMVEAARSAGNRVEMGDAFSFLETHHASFDGIFSAHFIERAAPAADGAQPQPSGADPGAVSGQ
jgi:O-antigen chain-terminating methyltransferase